jgi:hypothetical protein
LPPPSENSGRYAEKVSPERSAPGRSAPCVSGPEGRDGPKTPMLKRWVWSLPAAYALGAPTWVLSHVGSPSSSGAPSWLTW